ncbi:MAG: type II secretion system F family protein [Candidatus Omnitrophica bacterium]|nr:type II secretion system F family protein [Candidatus Omnitrophota bacterium]
MQSDTEEALIQRLQSEGYFIVDIRLAEERFSFKVEKKEKKQTFEHNKVKIEDLLVMSRQLATMLEAGVTMLRSLDIIISQMQSKQLYLKVKQIRDDIEQGTSLSAALAKHPKVFSQFWVSLADVGEASGTMPVVLNKLADHVERELAFRAAIVSAMIYPSILFVVCNGAVVFFALFVAPKFESIYQAMHYHLPIITQCLLNFFSFMRHYLLLFFCFLAGLIVALRIYFATTMGRLQFEKIIFGLPVVGNVVKLIIMERFTAHMAILIESGVPILYALEITERLVDNKTCGLVVSQVRESVREGKGMADALIETEFFPMMAIQMINVGEETGDLGKMLKHVAKYYQASVESFMKRVETLVEPFMLIFMAVVIGFIVVAIFMPLFKIGQAGIR